MEVESIQKLRIDKYLWAIRVFKTRSIASEACNSGKVLLNDNSVKASHSVKQGERYTIKIDKYYSRIIEVKGLLEKRQSYSVSINFYIEHTSVQERPEIQPDAFLSSQGRREKGSGRPTKKDRRKLGGSGFIG
ncbi:MAG: RNA-binding S4 domain-containing protein [Bacteroidota bacterium]